MVSFNPFFCKNPPEHKHVKVSDELEFIYLLEYMENEFQSQLLLPTFKNNGKELGIVHISTKTIDDHRSTILPASENKPTPESYIINRAYHICLKLFSVTNYTMDIFTSSSYSIVALGTYDESSGLVDVLGCVFYHFNPIIGTLVPFICIDEDVQKQGYGSLLLGILQHSFLKMFGISRVLIWFLDDSKASNLISFYRKLGFFATISGLYPLSAIMPRSPVSDMRLSSVEDTFLLETRESIIDKRKQKINTLQKVILNGFKDFRVTKSVHKIKYSILQRRIKKEPKCCICNISLGANDSFSYCSSFCTTNDGILLTKNQKKKEICGVITCFTCLSSFGMDATLSACPLHFKVANTNYLKFTKKEVKNHKDNHDSFVSCIKKEYTKLLSFSNKSIRSQYFNGFIESGAKPLHSIPISQGNDVNFCVHCKIVESLKKNCSSDKNSLIDHFTKYRSLSINENGYPVNRVNQLHFVNRIHRLDELHDCGCQHEGRKNHSLFLDANIGVPSSFLSNRVFGIKPILAWGDCGFLAIYIAIVTSPNTFRTACIKKILQYIKTTEKVVFTTFDEGIESTKNKIPMKKPSLRSQNVKAPYKKKLPSKSIDYDSYELKINHLRKAFFLAHMKDFLEYKLELSVLDKKFDLQDEKCREQFVGYLKDIFNLEGGTTYCDSDAYSIIAQPLVMDMFCKEGNKFKTQKLGELMNLYCLDNTSTSGQDVVFLDWTFFGSRTT